MFVCVQQTFHTTEKITLPHTNWQNTCTPHTFRHPIQTNLVDSHTHTEIHTFQEKKKKKTNKQTNLVAWDLQSERVDLE